MINDNAPLSVSIRVPLDALDLSEPDRSFYAALGYFTAHCASLEFLTDQFIFEYAKLKTPLVRKTKNFPFKMQEKIDFVISAYIENKALRTCGDADDRLCLNGLGYLFEEIWEARKHLIHGTIYFSENSNENFSFRSTRYVRERQNEYATATFDIDHAAILYLLDNISYLKSILHNALRILDGELPKTELDEIRKNRAAFRELRQSLLDEGIEIDSNGLLRFFSGKQDD